MPNRIIKESAFLSDKIAELSDFEFRLWVGLITQADDAGRGDARPAIIKGRIFALRERTTLKDIDAALNALAAVGCVSLYTVGGKPYYQFPNWGKHQRVRDAKPKYPGESDADDDCADASPQLAATRRESPPKSNPIQSKSNPNPNPTISTEPQAPAVLTLPLVDGTDYPITQSDIDEWHDAFPNVDVLQQLKAMKLWLKDNPTKKKTQKGVRRFVTNWLDKEQNRGGTRYNSAPQTVSAPTPPPDASQRERPSDKELVKMMEKWRG